MREQKFLNQTGFIVVTNYVIIGKSMMVQKFLSVFSRFLCIMYYFNMWVSFAVKKSKIPSLVYQNFLTDMSAAFSVSKTIFSGRFLYFDR